MGKVEEAAVDNGRTKRILFALMVVAAMACIVFGIYRVWGSFTEFDETILREKDSQYYSLIQSDDINIENSMDSFMREAETLFTRPRLEMLRREWVESEYDSTDNLQTYFEVNALVNNPVYKDLLLIYKDKVKVAASRNTDYKYLTAPNEEGISICADDENTYYISYEYKVSKNIKYAALMDIEQLYINALGMNSTEGLMLLDNTSTMVLYNVDGKVMMVPASAETDENTAALIKCLVDNQNSQTVGGHSLELVREGGEPYTARMIVLPTSNTVNRYFAIGVTADYEQAIMPSRRAAGRIVIFGGIAVVGIILLIFMILLLRRENTANARELELLKKKNTAMEELNQNMLALSHHQRLETIGTMTASIAHDFNNLLTPIMGYSMMSMEMLPPEMEDVQENLMEVYNASVKAKDMVTRLAELTKKGKEENFTDLDPAEIISNSLKVTVPAKPKNVDVKVRFRSNNRKMRGDATQISQLVMNIVLNAYDAMREKGGTIYISTGIEDNRIAMRFRDTGDGMDAETVARIFDPFYTTKESGKGTGLGLAIVAQIAETHGGKVYVDSTPGEGTEFKITFPMLEKENKFDRSKTIQISLDDIREAQEH